VAVPAVGAPSAPLHSLGAAPPLSPSTTPTATTTTTSAAKEVDGKQLSSSKSINNNNHGGSGIGSTSNTTGLLELFGGLDLTCPGPRSNRPRSLLELATQVKN
jgi:hypothetical protein